MRQTTDVWADLAGAGRFRMESIAVIGGVEHTAISAPVIDRALFTGDLSVGNCTAASLRFSVLTDTEIPKSAEIVIRARLAEGENVSEWKDFGVFYINDRTVNNGLVTLQCFDTMLKGNQAYVDETKPDDRIGWPKSMQACVTEIAYRMGVELDPRTVIKTSAPYVVPYPTKLTMLQVLGYIGAVHGGNWIITPENRLRLVPLLSPPDETFDIVDQAYNKIHTGDDHKLVWRHPASSARLTHPAGGGIVHVPVVIGKITTGKELVISRVTITRDAKLGYTAGDSTGYELKIEENPYACQAICDDLLEQLKGVLYSPYTITNACYDPAAELGDWLLVRDQVRSVLYSEKVKMDINLRADASAPGKEETSSEYPYLTEIQKLRTEDERLKEYMDDAKDEISSRIEQTYTDIILEVAGTYATQDAVSASINIVAEAITTEVSRSTAAEEELSGRIQVTADDITAEVRRASEAEGELASRIQVTADDITVEVKRASEAERELASRIQVTAENITSEISDTEQSLLSVIDQRVDSIGLSVTNGESSATIALTVDGVAVQSKTIKFTGDIIFASDLVDGKTLISGSNIQTGQINADLIISGKIQSKNKKVYFDLDNNEIACSKMINRTNESITIGGVSYANVVAELQTVTVNNRRSYGLFLYKQDNTEYGMLFTPGVSSSSRSYIRSGSSLTIQTSLEGSGYPYIRLDKSQDRAEMVTGGNSVLLLYNDLVTLQNGSGGYMQISPGGSLISGGLDVKNGEFKAWGTKNRVFQTEDYGERLLYCYETAHPLFGDVGRGELDGSGRCYIVFDDIFAETINSGMSYQVFLQAEGEGRLWIDKKEKEYFIAKGTPGLSFSWEVKARQADYDHVRLEDAIAPDKEPDVDYEAQGAKIIERYIGEMEEMVYAEIDEFY